MRELVVNFKEYIDNVADLSYSEFEEEINNLDEFSGDLKNLLIGALFLELRFWRGTDARRASAAGN